MDLFKFIRPSQDSLDVALYKACCQCDVEKISHCLKQGASPCHRFSNSEEIKLRGSEGRAYYEDAEPINVNFEVLRFGHNEPPHFGNRRVLSHSNKLARARPTCFHEVVASHNNTLLNRLVASTRPAGALMHELLLLAMKERCDDIVTTLLDCGGMTVLDGAILRTSLEYNSLPFLRRLLAIREDFTPMGNLVLEFAIKNQSTQVLELFRNSGFHVSIGETEWLQALQLGSSQFLRELLQHDTLPLEMGNRLLQAAVDSGNVEEVSILIDGGIGNPVAFKALINQISDDKKVLKDYLKLAHKIVAPCDATNEAWITHIETFIGLTRSQMRDQKIEAKDLFRFDPESNFRDTPFAKIALRAAFLAASTSGGEPGVAHAMLGSLLKRDLIRISKTNGLSWNRYANSVAQEAKLASHLPELFHDISEALMMPVWAIDHLVFTTTDAEINKMRTTFENFVGALFLEEKDTLNATLISRRWLRQVDRIVAEYRPALVGLEWSALFQPVELDSGLKVVCLTSTAQLVDEGKAMKHCVGSGAYATGCSEGIKHIISIRSPTNQSIATIELSLITNGGGTISLGRHGRAKVVQFKGHHNSDPSLAAKRAWDQFLTLLQEGKIEISQSLGITEEAKRKISSAKFVSLFGFAADDAAEVIPAMYNRYMQISYESKNGYRCPFFAPTVSSRLLGKFIDNVKKDEA